MDIVDFTQNVFHSKHLCSRELPVFFSLCQPHPLTAHGDGGTIPSRTQRAGPLGLALDPHHMQGYSFSVAPGEAWWNSRGFLKVL